MKNKVLKLCKRLSKVTASEIAPILMLDEKEVSNILNELVSEDKLTVREDLIYFYSSTTDKTASKANSKAMDILVFPPFSFLVFMRVCKSIG